MLTLVKENQTQGDLRVFGTRLREARLLRGRPAKSIASSMGVSAVRYSRLENTSEPSNVSEEELAALSTSLQFDQQYFTAPPTTFVNAEDMCFRAKKSLTKTSVDTIGAWAAICGDLIQAMFETTSPLPVSLPNFTGTPAPEAAAMDVRRLIGLSDHEPIDHLTRRMERAGIYIFSAPFEAGPSPRHDAVSVWVGDKRQYPIVLLRHIESWERVRMSSAHELGHIAMHRYGKPEQSEEEAFAFAGALLMPLAAFRADWPRRVTLGSLLPLKLKWGASIGAIIERGYRAGLLGQDVRTTLYKQLSRRDPSTGLTWRTQEPGWDEREPERPLLVRRFIQTHFEGEATIDGIREAVAHRPVDIVQPIVEGQYTITERPSNVVDIAARRATR